VAGNGQSELLEAITGLRPWSEGTIALNGSELSREHSDPRIMRALQVAHVPEDRHRRGMVMGFEACENSILGYESDRVNGAGPLLSRSSIISQTEGKMETYDVRPRNARLKSSLFSGGNQQKLVLAREFDRDPDLLVIGQPTRGVDIGAIEFIHKKIIALRDAGKAILLVSVELDEIRSLSDRVLVMFAGRIMGECAPGTEEKQIGLLMAGLPLSAEAA